MTTHRIPLGATLADRGHKLIKDNGNATGNNYDTETLSKMVIMVPPDSEMITYTLGGLDYSVVGQSEGINSGLIDFQEKSDGTRVFTITSSTLESGGVASLSLDQRLDAENDMLQSIQMLTVELGPEHNDMDGVSGVCPPLNIQALDPL